MKRLVLAAGVLLLADACSPASTENRNVLAEIPHGGVSLSMGSDGQLYWATFDSIGNELGSGALWKLDPKPGGQPIKLADRNALEISVVDGFVYFSDPVGSRGGVGRVSTRGGKVQLYESGGEIVGVAADESFAYWVRRGKSGGVFRVPLEGGDASELAATTEAWGQLVIAGDYLYWITLEGMARMPRAGGDIERILEKSDWKCCARGKPLRFLIEGELIYWVSGELDSGGLVRMRTDGSELRALGDPGDLHTSTTFTQSAVAVDGDEVYWSRGSGNGYTNDGDSEVVRTGTHGGSVERIAGHQNGVNSIVVSDDEIYWINTLGGTLAHAEK